jgi:hypothetical protein
VVTAVPVGALCLRRNAFATLRRYRFLVHSAFALAQAQSSGSFAFVDCDVATFIFARCARCALRAPVRALAVETR